MLKIIPPLLFLILGAILFAYNINAPLLVSQESSVYVRFFTDDGKPARGIVVFIEGPTENLTLVTDNAGYINFKAKGAGSYTYRIQSQEDKNLLIEFEQKTHIIKNQEENYERSNLIQNTIQATYEMGQVLVSSATIVVPLFVVFLIIAFIAVYITLKD
ncbi:MAG: hypothetical protein QXW70_03920 [Candidatus Anstonellales archaeon]